MHDNNLKQNSSSCSDASQKVIVFCRSNIIFIERATSTRSTGNLKVVAGSSYENFGIINKFDENPRLPFKKVVIQFHSIRTSKPRKCPYPIKITHPTKCPNSNCVEIEIVSPYTYITSYKTPIALRGVQAQFFFFMFSRETNSRSTHCRNNNNNGNNNNNNIISFLLDGGKKINIFIN